MLRTPSACSSKCHQRDCECYVRGDWCQSSPAAVLVQLGPQVKVVLHTIHHCISLASSAAWHNADQPAAEHSGLMRWQCMQAWLQLENLQGDFDLMLPCLFLLHTVQFMGLSKLQTPQFAISESLVLTSSTTRIVSLDTYFLALSFEFPA